jgi:hypothetical protein
LAKTNANANFRGTPNLHSILFGRRLKLGRGHFPEGYYVVEGQDFWGGDIFNEPCSWEEA